MINIAIDSHGVDFGIPVTIAGGIRALKNIS